MADDPVRDETEETAGEQITRHARQYHPWDFDDVDDEELADMIDGTILNPDDSKEIVDDAGNKRQAYWNDEEGLIVIVDPNAEDGGTGFRPDEGKAYFDALK